MAKSFERFLDEIFADSIYSFSIGSSGALAEFPAPSKMSRDWGTYDFSACVPEGAIGVKTLPDLRWIAYETLSKRPTHWNYELIAHANKTALSSSKRSAITELGKDHNALNTIGSKEVIFDLGLGLENADFCIRTSDAGLKNVLRKHSGTHIAREKHPLLETLIEASPTRVVSNKFGRIEVYQRISRHNTPNGPHTHLLPALLSRKNQNYRFLPKGRIPVLFVHPPTPLVSAQNNSTVLDMYLYRKFEKISERFGWPEYVNSKRKTLNRLTAGDAPHEIRWSNEPLARIGQKVALRQFIHL